MRRHQVIITASALQDMEELYNYIADVLEAPAAAKRIYFKIANAIQSLELFAERYKVFYTEDKSLVRRMIVENYSVFYIFEFDCVKVTRVIYSSSNLSERLRLQ